MEVRLNNDYDKKVLTYYNAESEINKYLGFSNDNNSSSEIKLLSIKIVGKMILRFG